MYLLFSCHVCMYFIVEYVRYFKYVGILCVHMQKQTNWYGVVGLWLIFFFLFLLFSVASRLTGYNDTMCFACRYIEVASCQFCGSVFIVNYCMYSYDAPIVFCCLKFDIYFIQRNISFKLSSKIDTVISLPLPPSFIGLYIYICVCVDSSSVNNL